MEECQECLAGSFEKNHNLKMPLIKLLPSGGEPSPASILVKEDVQFGYHIVWSGESIVVSIFFLVGGEGSSDSLAMANDETDPVDTADSRPSGEVIIYSGSAYDA